MLWQTLWRWRVAIMVSVVGVLAAVVRFVGLAYPHALVFDEVFYVRGAYSLSELGYEGDWTGENGDFARGDLSGLTTNGDFIVHPMLGKILIQLGIEAFGNNPYGWRFSTALAGVIIAVLTAVIARHLFRSTLWGAIAGVFVALDGISIVLSRTALLDNFLALFAVTSLGLILLDRSRTRTRLFERAARTRAELGLASGETLPGWGPWMGPRWWRLLAMVSMGCAVSVKWSGVYFAVAFMALSVVYDIVDRRAAGYRAWLWGSLGRAVLTAVTTIAVMLAVYVATWFQWFASDKSYGRHWAEQHPDEGVQWLPPALRSLLHYHQQMWDFHTSLTSSHSYMSDPFGWILQLRPTAFFYETVDSVACGADSCVSAIHAIGHPLIWWTGAAALAYAIYRIVRRGDLLALTVAIGVLAGWVPWFPYYYRTIFTFYSVAFAPFVVLTLVYALRRWSMPDGVWTRAGALAVGGFVAAVFVLAAFFLPIWTGMPIPFRYWQVHMWIQNVKIGTRTWIGWV